MEKLIAINAENCTLRSFLHILGNEFKRKKNVKKKGKHFKIQGLKYSEATCYSPVSSTFCWEMGGDREHSWGLKQEKSIPSCLLPLNKLQHSQVSVFFQGNIKRIFHSATASAYQKKKKKSLVSQDFCTKLGQLFKPFSLRMIVEKFQGSYCWIRKCELVVDIHTKRIFLIHLEYADMVICVSHHTLNNQRFSLIAQQYGEIPKRLLIESNSCIAKTVAYTASFVIIFFTNWKQQLVLCFLCLCQDICDCIFLTCT